MKKAYFNIGDQYSFLI